MNLRKYTIVLLVLFAVATTMSCASVFGFIDTNKISLGMSKQQVRDAVKVRPDNIVSAKTYPEGAMEIVQYSIQSVSEKDKAVYYWLYFLNDKLLEWRTLRVKNGLPDPRYEDGIDYVYQTSVKTSIK